MGMIQLHSPVNRFSSVFYQKLIGLGKVTAAEEPAIHT